MDVNYFPFDEQRCTMSYGSWTYNGDEVRVLPYVAGFTRVRPNILDGKAVVTCNTRKNVFQNILQTFSLGRPTF